MVFIGCLFYDYALSLIHFYLDEDEEGEGSESGSEE
jgi:hypothetical protein